MLNFYLKNYKIVLFIKENVLVLRRYTLTGLGVKRPDICNLHSNGSGKHPDTHDTDTHEERRECGVIKQI